MRQVLTILVLLFSLSASAQLGTMHIDSIQTGFPGNGYPNSYLYALVQTPLDSGSANYHGHQHPLWFFGHGAGERGTGIAGLSTLANGVNACMPYDIAHGTLRLAFWDPINQDSVYPIGVFLQAATSSGWGVSAPQLDSAIGYCERVRWPGIVDTNRVAIFGLSAGGEEGWDLPGRWNASNNTAYVPRYHLTAMVLMSAVINWNSAEGQQGYKYIIQDSVHSWMMGDSSNAGGDIHGIQSAQAADSFHLNSFCGNAAAYLAPTFQQFAPGTGHGGWPRYFLPTWDTTVNGKLVSIYTWALQFTRAQAAETVTVNPGNNQNLAPLTVQTTLSGSATTSTGSITSYLWTQISGPSCTIGNPNVATTIVNGLQDGNVYTFKLTATNTDNYQGSGVMTVTVGSITGRHIVVNTNTIYYNGNTAIQAFVSLSRDTAQKKLWDEQAIYDPKNFPNQIPGTYPQISINPQFFYNQVVYPLYDSGLVSWVYLGGLDTLHQVYARDTVGNDSLYFYTGSPYAPQVYFAGTTSGYAVNITLTNDVATSWFGVRLKSGQSNISEIALYGNDYGSHLPTVPTTNFVYPKPTVKQWIGDDWDNFPYWPPILSQGLGEQVRLYHDGWAMDTNRVNHALSSLSWNFDVNATKGDTIIYTNPLDTSQLITFRWPANTMLNLFDSAIAYGDTLIPTLQGGNTRLLGGFPPIDTVLHPRPNPYLPANYDELGLWAANYDLVFGNSGGAINTKILYPPSSVNNNVVKSVEIGNEWNGGEPPNQYFWPVQAMAAEQSEMIDGNAGQNAGQGFKTQDPNIKVVYAAMANPDTSFYDGQRLIWSLIRPDANPDPGDAIDYHRYYGTSPNPSTSHGLCPEAAGLPFSDAAIVNHFHRVSPGKPVFVSEFGYDANPASQYGVTRGTNSGDTSLTQAEWDTRETLLLMAAGITHGNHFKVNNQDANSALDHNPNVFCTMGLFSYYEFDSAAMHIFKIFAKKSYYFRHSLVALMGNYYFDSLVRAGQSDSVYILRYRNAGHSDSVIYAIWKGTATGQSSSNYPVSIGSAYQNIQSCQFADKSLYGNFNSFQAGPTGQVTLSVTENPIFILSSGSTIVHKTFYIIDQTKKKFYKART